MHYVHVLCTYAVSVCGLLCLMTRLIPPLTFTHKMYVLKLWAAVPELLSELSWAQHSHKVSDCGSPAGRWGRGYIIFMIWTVTSSLLINNTVSVAPLPLIMQSCCSGPGAYLVRC